jgi:hypothetical protein
MDLRSRLRLENLLDGAFGAAFIAATGGGRRALNLLKGFLVGASVRSLGQAYQNGLLDQTTCGTCIENAGLSYFGHNPAPVSF